MFHFLNSNFGKKPNTYSKNKLYSNRPALMHLEQRVTPVVGTGTGVPTILTEGTALVTEYHLNYPSNPTSGSTHEIVDDPANDNSYWITGMSMDTVVHYFGNTNTAQYFQMPMGSMPHGIVFDPTGALWVSLEYAGQVVKLDQTTGAILVSVDVNIQASPSSPVPLNPHPHAIAIGADGVTIWFTGKNTSTVGKINPVNGAITSASTVTHYNLPTVAATPIYLELGTDGNIWGTELTGNNIFRVTPTGTVTEFPIPTSNSRPIAIKVGPAGDPYLWFTEEAGNNIGKISYSGVIEEFPVPKSQSNSILAGFAFDAQGNLWTQSYVNQNNLPPTGPDYIVRMGNTILNAPNGDISSVLVTRYQVESEGTVFHRIVLGDDGDMWFTELALNNIGKVKIVSNPAPLLAATTPTSSDSRVTLYNSSTAANLGFVNPFPGFTGVISTATGSFRNNGVAYTVAAAGPGGGPAIAIVNTQTGEVTKSFFAYDPSFSGGVSIALADFNNDGVLDLVTGAGPGGGPQVNIFDGSNFSLIKSFFAFDSNFRGGVNVGAGDINQDGSMDIVVAAGAGGGPEVRVFNGATLAVISQWYAYESSFSGGVTVAVGDLGDDGVFEVVTGAGSGGSPLVKVFNANTGAFITQFLAYADSFKGGISVGINDGDGNGTLDIITGAGAGGGPQVNAFDYPTLDLLFSFYSGDSTNTKGVVVGTINGQFLVG
jgi:virginiamycin B lyase